jgi:anti-sigma regulatory factor (Ser/Thr protein kinase)
MTGCPDDVASLASARTGAASTVQAPTGGAVALPEPGSGAGRAFHPDRLQPRHTLLELAALPSAVPCARLHTRNVIAEWGMTSTAETAELLVSELVTNAIAETSRMLGPGAGSIVMRLTAGAGMVLIEVLDSSNRAPERRHVKSDAENGRGLLLVDTLSAGWGACPVPGHGKIVWCIVRGA